MILRDIKNFFIISLILALAGYAVYLNIDMKNKINQYEASAVEMANRFQRVNEDAIKAREELARQAVLTEEANAAAVAAKAAAEKAMAASEAKARSAARSAEVASEELFEQSNPPVKEKVATDAKSKAEAAKAAAERMLKEASSPVKNLWEEREAHL